MGFVVGPVVQAHNTDVGWWVGPTADAGGILHPSMLEPFASCWFYNSGNHQPRLDNPNPYPMMFCNVLVYSHFGSGNAIRFYLSNVS